MKSRFQKSILKYLVASLILHSLFMIGVHLFDKFNTKPIRETISLDLVTPPPAVKSAATAVKKKNYQPPNQQIVDQDEKPVNDDQPDKTRFLSRNNQKIEKQTIARNKGEFQNKQDKKNPPQRVNKTPTLKDLTPQFDAFAAMQRQEKKEQEKKGQLNSENPNTGDASQSPDYIKDVDMGVETMLSTKEFKYYTYFNRIRRQLSQYWEPKVREKLNIMFKQGRKIASEDDKITKLVIFLNPTGQLVKVQVISESGVRDLDEAAIEAFRAAAPFPNPPQGIIDSDGTAKIRWDFILES